ncbi:MAG: TIGR03905 family TSCPD domain-containing protein [Clostridia bacterium]|nr:TIGR03905 family TSCPD domain-containing protein [Clostridia bacterium]
MKYVYNTRGTCSTQISFELTDGTVSNVSFVRGCNGNLKAIAKLVEGMEAEKLISILKGNSCGMRSTSCADQLAIAVENALKEQADK